MGSIAPFRQLGGDAASREGWRIAVSLLYDGLKRDKKAAREWIQQLGLCDSRQAAAQFFLADQYLNSVISTSAGRLFDAVSAILGLCRQSTFEGEGAMALQFAAEAWEQAHGEELLPDEPLQDDGNRMILPTGDLVLTIIRRRLTGEEPGKLAYAFHLALAGMITAAAVQVRHDTGLAAVALSGGVFQNTLLLRLCQQGLEERKFTVLTHCLVPPNDGGLALGQAVYAMHVL